MICINFRGRWHCFSRSWWQLPVLVLVSLKAVESLEFLSASQGAQIRETPQKCSRECSQKSPRAELRPARELRSGNPQKVFLRNPGALRRAPESSLKSAPLVVHHRENLSGATWRTESTWIVIFFFSYNKPPPSRQAPDLVRPISVSFGPFLVASGESWGVGWGRGGVRERGFCTGKSIIKGRA